MLKCNSLRKQLGVFNIRQKKLPKMVEKSNYSHLRPWEMRIYMWSLAQGELHDDNDRGSTQISNIKLWDKELLALPYAHGQIPR